MSPTRQTFSEMEKNCLQELITKYELSCPASNKAGSLQLRKAAWGLLVVEYNSIATNSKRTLNQLRKCWDNMKTRRKNELTQDKYTIFNGSPFYPSTSEEETTVDADPTAAFYVESVIEEGQIEEIDEITGKRIKIENPIKIEPEEIVERQADYQLVENYQEDYVLNNKPELNNGTEFNKEDREDTDVESVRIDCIRKEHAIRMSNYKKAEERYKQLHKLKLTEQMWLTRAAEEKYKKALLEREKAEKD